MTTGDTDRRVLLQQALFDEQSDADASALVAVTAREGPLGAAQRTFNRLTGRIRRGRENLGLGDLRSALSTSTGSRAAAAGMKDQ